MDSTKSKRQKITFNSSDTVKTGIKKIVFDSSNSAKSERKKITLDSPSTSKKEIEPIDIQTKCKPTRQVITFDSPTSAKKERKKITFDRGDRSQGSQRNQRQDAQTIEEEEERTLNAMQPELLPIVIMNELLKQRGANISQLNAATRPEIVRLFYKHITPKPQRIYQDNRLGKILLKLRKSFMKIDTNIPDWERMVTIQEEKMKFKRKRDSSLSPTVKSTLESPVCVSSPPNLKPPTSCIDMGKRKIKLSSNISTDLNLKVMKRDSRNKKPAEGTIVTSNSTTSEAVKRPSFDSEPPSEKKKIKLQRTILRESKPVKDGKAKPRSAISWP